MTAPIRVLLVEDSDTDAKLLTRALAERFEGAVVDRVQDAEAMRAALTEGEWDVVLSDWSMPRFNALEGLGLLKDLGLDIPFIIVSGTVGEDRAVEALRAGAHDYLLKDRLARLGPAVERELRERKGREALRRSEERLRQVQKMEAIGGLAAGVAHDFNNLLSLILGHGSLVLAGLDPKSPIRPDIESIMAAGERATDLTHQLLAFSRKQVLRPRLVDLNAVLAAMGDMLRRLIGEDVELSIASSPHLGSIRVDPGQLQQILMNLAVNARDAMPTGGKLLIETSNNDAEPVSTDEPFGALRGPAVVLTVTDNGIGMDEATRARVFEPFFTTKELGKGTGLGLSTVFGIVQQSGGAIAVESEPGHGARFKVFFPRVFHRLASDDTWSAEETASVTLDGTETILLVEDDAGVRELCRVILRRHGYFVLSAANGSEAFTLCDECPRPIHLLITDVVMPNMSGVQLSERLIRVYPQLKVLFVSGYAPNPDFRIAVDDVRRGFLQKPITPERLARAARRILDTTG